MPFPYPVGWWDAQVEVDGAAYPLGSAEANAYIEIHLLGLERRHYDVYNAPAPCSC